MATRLELGALEGPEMKIMDLWNDQIVGNNGIN